jgi:RND family efflux transporter MFP subunit
LSNNCIQRNIDSSHFDDGTGFFVRDTHMRLFCLFILLILLSGCDRDPKPNHPTQNTLPVKVQPVKLSSEQTYIEATGSVANQAEARLSFKTGGILQQIDVEAGDNVVTGQVLAKIDNTELNAQFKQAQTQLEKAKRDLRRANELFQQGVIAKQTAQDAASQLSLAESAMSSARFNLQQSVIKAKSNGIILHRFAEAGEMVAPGSPVVTFASHDSGWVIRAGLSEKDALNVTRGNKAEIRLRAHPDLMIDSYLSELGSATDPLSGTIEATLPISITQNRKLISGQIADVRIQLEPSKQPQIMVPLSAILEANLGQAHVYIINDSNVAQKKPVTLGNIKNNHIEIRHGLNLGDRLVVEGAAWLNANSPVRIIP